MFIHNYHKKFCTKETVAAKNFLQEMFWVTNYEYTADMHSNFQLRLDSSKQKIPNFIQIN